MELYPNASLSPKQKKHFKITQKKTTKFVNIHLQVDLLWKDDFPILQDNHEIDIQHFKSLQKRFLKNPEFFNMFRTQINDYITLRQAKLLPPKEKKNSSSITNYIPKPRVLNKNKPGRVRVVFDALTKINKICLNDNLLPGINFYTIWCQSLQNSKIENMP